MKPKKEILIAGAGPTGLVLGLVLDKFGVPFQIIDENSGPGTASRAMAVVPGTLDHYSQLGLVDDVVNDGIEIKRNKLKIKNREKILEVESFGKSLVRFPYLLTYPQDEHEALLVSKLEALGHHISWNTTFKSLRQNWENVQVIMKKGSEEITHTYRYAVGCDGGSSDVRKSLNSDFEGETNKKLFYVADVEIANASNDIHQGNMFLSGEDFTLLFPLRNQETHRLIGMIPDHLTDAGQTGENHVLPYLEEKFGLDIEACNWFSEYKIHHRIAGTYKKGRIFLAGDAAHLHSPVGGQGMNAGIADAVNLGWKLAHVIKGKIREEALETYEQERKEFAEKLVATTDRLFKVISSNNSLIIAAREAFFPALAEMVFNDNSRVGKKVFKLVSQTEIKYETSSLHSSSSADKLIGSKLPYTGDNFTAVDEMNWQVHVYGEIEDSFKDFCREKQIPFHVFEWKKEMKGAGLVKNAAYFIRPDGYIAWMNKNQLYGPLHTYINTWSLRF